MMCVCCKIEPSRDAELNERVRGLMCQNCIDQLQRELYVAQRRQRQEAKNLLAHKQGMLEQLRVLDVPTE